MARAITAALLHQGERFVMSLSLVTVVNGGVQFDCMIMRLADAGALITL